MNRGPGSREGWMLALLAVPGNDGTSVCSGDHLMQSMFVLNQELGDKSDLDFPFQFESGKYGPMDASVPEQLEALREKGLVKVTQDGGTCCKPTMQSYELTAKGEQQAQEILRDVSPGIEELLEWVKTEHTQAPLGQLRSYLYSHYPETFD